MSDYFEKAKVGDKVFDIDLMLSGKISRLMAEQFSVWINSDKGNYFYSYAGTFSGSDKQTLFYVDEVEFVIKPRKRMVKKECVRYIHKCNSPESLGLEEPRDSRTKKVTITWEEESND